MEERKRQSVYFGVYVPQDAVATFLMTIAIRTGIQQVVTLLQFANFYNKLVISSCRGVQYNEGIQGYKKGLSLLRSPKVLTSASNCAGTSRHNRF